MFDIGCEEIIKLLDEKFKHRNKDTFQKKIDEVVQKIRITSNHRKWKNFIDNTILECYTNYKGVDFISNFNELYFLDNEKLYFVYRILLKLEGLSIVKNIRIKVMNESDGLRKFYFDNFLELLKEKDNKFSDRIDILDSLAQRLELKDELVLRGNVKFVTAALMSKTKYKSFRTSSNLKEVVYKIKSIKDGEVKEIPCPVCKKPNIIHYKDKNILFQLRNDKVFYNCQHEASQFINKKQVAIPLKEYKKELKDRNIDAIDFVIYNYKYFFKKYVEKE